MEHQSYSLFELNQYVKQVIALNFEVGIWIETEIAQVSRSRNHIYLDLVEKSDKDDQILALAKATIWYRTSAMLKKKYGDLVDQTLVVGQTVKLLVSVEFHERYGYSLNIQDLDPQFTLGKIVLKREEIIKQLQKEQLLESNNERHLGPVLQRIAVLSSENAAGYHDFFTSLSDNDFNYYFDITLYPIALQGHQVKDDVNQTLIDLNEFSQDFDCIVIIRGGGAKIDLAAFDNIDIARSIARASLPVFTGIGHEIDIVVADVVAYNHFKTPTAVADYIIQHNRRYEEGIYDLAYRLEQASKEYLYREHQGLRQIKQLLNYQLYDQIRILDVLDKDVHLLSRRYIDTAKRDIEHSERIVQVSHPDHILNQGYSITTILVNGELIDNAVNVEVGQSIHTQLNKGHLISVIKE